ncbi:MAG: YjbQ family protein [Planctomycetes bacterium]|nr:YjbQ family protein [Planctomycetota bacterium]
MKTHTETLTVRTSDREQMLDITSEVVAVLDRSNIRDGLLIVHIPHTTAGVTINENADPDVVHDILAALEKAVPWQQGFYQHCEGNSAAHVKSSMMGCSQTLLVKAGRLTLGTWQGVWFCEFDGPRTRQAVVQVMGE